jgi:hypothetical protein
VETSTDGKKFSSLFDGVGRNQPVTHNFGTTQARYIRINMRNPATHWGYSLYEIEVYEK